MRKQGWVQGRLSNIREAKMRIERKQEEIRLRLKQLETDDDGVGNREKRMEHLGVHLAKLEQRHTFLMSREREVEELLRGCSVCEEEREQDTMKCEPFE